MKAPLSTLAIISGLATFSAGLEAQSKFVYTNNDLATGNSVSAFLDTNGTLTEIANSPFSSGGNGAGGGLVAVERIVVAGGKFLYASNDGSQTIAAFAIDATTGALTPLSSSPYADGAATTGGDISLAPSADGQYLFAGVSANSTIVTFKIQADGSLAQVASTASPAAPIGMKVSADGKYLAAGVPAYLNFGGIALFSISSGALTLVNGMPFIGTSAVAGVDINCAAGEVFGGVMSGTAEIVDSYTLSSGSLTRVQGSPINSSAAKGADVVVLSPDDTHLFVSNQFSNSITSFSVGSTGALTMVGSPLSVGTGNPAGMATDQTGTTLYMANATNQIYVLNIASDGSLSAVAGSPFSTNQAGGVLSLAAYPGKTCPVLGGGGGTPPPPPPPPPPPGSDPLTVNIQIMADNGNSTNAAITPHGRTLVRVAILSSSNPSFNAPSQVDMTSLTFGHSGTEKSLAFCDTKMQDVNHDGLPDLVCHFYAGETGFVPTDTMGILGGMLTTGTQAIQGSASVKIAH